MRLGWRVKILPGVRIGSRGVRVGPRSVGLRVGRKSASITGGVGSLYYSTYSGRRRRGASNTTNMGCLAIPAVLFIVVPAAALIGAGLALYLVLWLLFAVSYGVVF